MYGMTLTLLYVPSIKYCSMETGCLIYGMTLTLLQLPSIKYCSMETGCLMYTYFVATTFHQVLLYGDRMVDVRNDTYFVVTTFHQVLLYGDRMFDVHLLCCNYLPSSTALWRQDVWCTLTLLQLPSIKYCSMETGCLMYGMTLTLL